jgi:filamentous hemagglutinin family protein
LSVVAQACLVALLVNGNAWSQANAVDTAAGQFTAKSGNASLVNGLPNGQTVIRLDNTKSILEWARLNVAQGNSLQFIQPNQQSVVLNRVTGSDATRIDGSLLSNGHVWLLNPSGVLFGAKSSVNVQSLLATTRAISDADFLTNKLHFSGGGSGQVSNAGVIAVGEGGYVVLSAQSVENTGNIQAQLGQVHLASGKAFVIDLNGDKLLRFDVTQALSSSDATESLVKNTGNILADGGRVQMTARAANGLLGQVVNTGGLLQANSVRSVNGEIVLDAGVGGKTIVEGTLSVQGNDANSKGGNITALGDNIQIASGARINASGQTGGGTVLIGGDWQGSGSLQQAKTVEMQQGSEIKANATNNGDGGKVVLWSDLKAETGSTSFAGVIQATAGPEGGQGGKVETSGHALKIAASAQVNSSSPKGQAGQWLLDPVNVTIDAEAATAIEDALQTSYVLVTTAGSSTPSNVNPFTSVRVGESGSDGNIYVNAPMTWNKYVLSLEAHGNIYVNAPITIGAIDNTFNPGTFGGLSIRTGYSTPAVNGGTYDATKALLFGKTSNGFNGRVVINDDSGNARTGFGFRLNDNDYTLINNLTALQNISGNLNGKYALSGSIDAAASASLNAGAGFVPLGNALGKFTGRFNGLGNTISGLVINRSNADLIGLFGSVDGAIISNVGLINANITGRGQVGGLIGQMKNGLLLNSYSKNAQITGLGEVGGLVGQLTVDDANAVTLKNNFFDGTITGTSGGSFGGGIGLIYSANNTYGDMLVQNNFANVTITSASSNVGGFIGNVSLHGAVNVNVFDNYSKGSVSSTADGVGGFLGVTDLNACAFGCRPVGKLNIARNYSNVVVSGNDGVGGFGGTLWNGYSDSGFSNNYATGNVSAGATGIAGGLIGYNQISQLNSFATGTVTGGLTMGGLVGRNWANLTGLFWNKTSSGMSTDVGTKSAGTLSVAGLTANEMKQQAKFTGFDFTTVSSPWFIYEGQSLPLLRGFLTPLTVTASGATNQVYNGTNVYSGPVTLSYSITPDNSLILGSNTFTLASKNVGTRVVSMNGGLYSNQDGYLITSVNNMGSIEVTAAALSVTANAATKTYDGTTTANGVGTVGVLAGAGAGEVVNVAGTQAFIDKNAGTNKTVRAAGVTIKDSGNADVTSNYNITYVDNTSSTINQAALNVTANAVTKTYDGTTAASGTGTVGVLAGAGAGEVVNAAGTQAFLDKNAGTNKTVRAAGVTIKDSGNADVTGNYNISYVDNTSSTINQAVLSVGVTGVNKAYDGNTNATVSTTDNRMGNDVLTISSSASFVDPLVATNKPVNVTGISISGTDAANYLLANTAANTTAAITPSQTTAAVQAAVSAALPSAAATSAFASTAVSTSVNSSSTSIAAAKTTTASGAATTSTQAVSGASATSTSASGVNPSASTGGTTTDEATNTALTAQNATSATTVAANSAATAPATTTAISVNTQTVARTAAVAATQATTAAQSTAATTGVATSNTSNQVQIVSLNTSSSRVTPPVGAQTIAPVQTPKSAEDQSDPVLAAVSSFKPATPASTNNRAPARGRDAPVVVPLVQGILVMETSPPKAATQAVDEQRLSASGDRSRW